MTFGSDKLVNMAGIFLIMVFGLFFSYAGDNLKRTRLALETFFEAELSDCHITSLIEGQYSGRGSYQLFTTDCHNEYYPILLDKKSEYEDYERFTEGLIVNKKANSVNLTLTGSNFILELKIRHPSDEDDRFENMKYVSIFFGIVLLIMAFIPNSYFERHNN